MAHLPSRAAAALLAAACGLQAQPTQISIELLTPDAQCIAGDTLVAVVQVRDANGLVPGTWCDTARYADSLAPSPMSSIERPPVVILNEGSAGLCPSISQAFPLMECFRNGVDTVRFIYWRARTADSLYRVDFSVGGVTASTPRFAVLPGSSDRLVLEHVNGTRVPDSLTLYAEQGESRLFYDASLAATNEAGYVIAHAVDTAQGRKADSVYITIVGPAKRLVEAVTADTNGNGYLDGVLLRFDRPISLNPDSLQQLLANLGFVHDSVSWSAVDMHVADDSTSPDSTVFSVSLREDSVSVLLQPQTGWTPYISLAGWPEVRNIPTGQMQAVDGAGPVIMYASVLVAPCSDTDTFYVTFSEVVIGTGGRALASMPLDSLFIGFDGCADTSHEVANLFAGSARVDTVTDTTSTGQIVSSIRFTVARFADTSRHCRCLSIRTSPCALIVDVAKGNPPVVGNRRVRVDGLIIADASCPPTDTLQEGTGETRCGCGAGTGVALLPPMLFSAGAWWRRRKKSRDAAGV